MQTKNIVTTQVPKQHARVSYGRNHKITQISTRVCCGQIDLPTREVFISVDPRNGYENYLVEDIAIISTRGHVDLVSVEVGSHLTLTAYVHLSLV